MTMEHIKTLFYLVLLLTCTLPAQGQTISGKSNVVHISLSEQADGARPQLSYSGVVFKDQNNNQAIDPQEEASISFTVTNEGKGKSQNLLVKAYTSNDIRGLAFPKEMKLDSLAPGKLSQISIPINTSRALEAGTANIIIEIKEEFEFDPDQIEINILTEEVKR